MLTVPINWEVFEYKFSANPRQAFESLAYMLFCFELNQKYGVFRYFNQPYIETQPVDTGDGNIIGFQAKYYDASTSLSSKKTELKDVIKGAKIKYKEINKIIFYINKEFSTSSKKNEEKPCYQKEIEQCGNTCGIKIEWRVKSNFEKILLSRELSILRDLYFNPNPDIYKFAEDIQMRSKTILNNIKSSITYQHQEIKIENAKDKLIEFVKSSDSAFIIYGDAGTGKSALVKDFVSEKRCVNDDSVFIMFAASDLDVEEEIFFLKKYGKYRLEDLFALYKNASCKICILDSVEKYTTFKYLDVFINILNKFIDDNWKIVITMRTVYKEGFCNLFFENIPYNEFKIEKIDENKLVSLSKIYNFELPQDVKMRELLCNLFYLKLYLSLDNKYKLESINVQKFSECIWRHVVRNEKNRYNNMPIRRESFIQNMVLDMLRKESHTYQTKPNDDYAARCCLEDSGVIAPYNDTDELWVMSHDVYEEIIVKHILSKRYNECTSVIEMFDNFGFSLRSRKMFRIWFESELGNCDDKCLDFLIKLLGNEKIEQVWKDETLIALMNTENDQAFHTLEMMLSEDEFNLFTRTVFLLNTACKNINFEMIKCIEKNGTYKYRYTKPIGNAWKTVFKYIYNNRNLISWSVKNLTIVADAIKSWASNYETGETTRLAGLIALYLKGEIWQESKLKYLSYNDELYDNISDTILMSALEIKEELSKIIEDIILEDNFSQETENSNILEKVMSNIFECGKAPIAIPLKILDLANVYWKFQKTNKSFFSYSKIEDDFGVNYLVNYYPKSAYQTPMYLLLCAAPKESIDFIIEIMNYSAISYRNSQLEDDHKECHDVLIVFSDKVKVKQICSDRLWKLHIGTSVAPELLECILMALEKWLLNIIPKISEDKATEYCFYLLQKSNNVAITSLVVSIVIAYPDKLFKVACVLLKTKEIFHYDISRFTSEITSNFLKNVHGKFQKFNEERIESNNMEFRKKRLEDIILKYQLQRGIFLQEEFDIRRKMLYTAIDEATQDINTWSPVDKYVYYRMDFRKYKEQNNVIFEGDTKFIEFKSDMPEELNKLREDEQKKSKSLFNHTKLGDWAMKRYIGDVAGFNKYSMYEDEPDTAFKEVMKIINSEEKNDTTIATVVIYTFVVLLRDFKCNLDADQIRICNQQILEIAFSMVDENSFGQIIGIETIIPELVNMSDKVNITAEWNNPIFLLLAIAMNNCKERGKAIENISKNLWKVNKKGAAKLVYTYMHIVRDYSQSMIKYGDMTLIKFFNNNKEKIDAIIAEESISLEFENIEEFNINEVLALNLMLDRTDQSIYEFIIKSGKLIWKSIFGDDEDIINSINYDLESEYVEWFADYILNQKELIQVKIIQEMLPLIRFDSKFGEWLDNIIIQEDRNPRYESFWNLWNLLLEYIYKQCDTDKDYYYNPNNKVSIYFGFDNVLLKYLFGGSIWRNDITKWHTLKKENSLFFRMLSKRIGYNPIILYSLSKVLNSVGKDTFISDGIEWISTIINNNPHLIEVNLPTNTIYYIEEYIYWYIREEGFYLREKVEKKKKVFIVLDFLVNRGSTFGFLLREEIV
ncbi:MAG: hypothetical protein U0N20_03885 [Clostridium sp.]